jgi:hypothetical protein
MRSFDGLNFEQIGMKSATNTADGQAEYVFTDRAVGASGFEKAWYRVIQVDLDGASTQSDRVELGLPAISGLEVKVFPNPVENELSFGIRTGVAGTVHFRLFDAAGARVMEQTIQLEAAGYHQQTFDLSRLAAGAYYYSVRQNGKQESGKIFKK